MTQILFVSLEGRIGGAETSLLLMVKYLRSQFLISVACPADTPLARRLANMQIDSFYLPNPPRRLYFWGLWLIHLLKTNYHMMKITYKTKPVLVHANSFYAVVASALATFLTGKKLIWHARDLTRFGLVSRFCSLFCERIIAVSNVIKDLLIKQGVKPSKIDVVYNGVEVEDFDCDVDSTMQSRISGVPTRFANIGQFVPWKEQILFLEAARRLTQKGVEAEFLLIGDDIFGRDSKYKIRLLHYAESSTIARRVHFLGWKENMCEVWPKVSCLVHTAALEPFGRVIIEAMAHKIPVIAVGTCGPSEIIQNGRTGILVEVGDIKGLSEAMLKIAQNPLFANTLANAGYDHVVSNFAAYKTAKRIQEIYEEVLSL